MSLSSWLHRVLTPNKIKTLTKLIITFLVIGAILLFTSSILRGVSTGKAIHFQSNEQLELEVKATLEKNLAINQFYPLVSSANLCVQVNEKDTSASFRVIKTTKTNAVRKAALPCDQDSSSYDFAVKFADKNSFDLLANDLTCDKIARINLFSKKVVILPSKYILSEFVLNPEMKVEKYCSILQICLSTEELGKTSLPC
jgi:hypothetical protein